eukprot:5595376-Amphidinium_carterae.1
MPLHSLRTRHLWSMQTPATTRIPPSYDGRTSWFQVEEAVEDWNDLAELESPRRGPALKRRLEGTTQSETLPGYIPASICQGKSGSVHVEFFSIPTVHTRKWRPPEVADQVPDHS